MHQGALKFAERKTPPVRRTARNTSDNASFIAAKPSEYRRSVGSSGGSVIRTKRDWA
jgi:hypothetical protein